MKRAAVALGVQLQSLEVRRPADFDRVFKAALGERAEGLVIVSSRLMSRQRQQIAEFAAKNRLIVAGGWGEWTNDGALLTYGPNTTELMQRIAIYVAKIPKGARPSDLPCLELSCALRESGAVKFRDRLTAVVASCATPAVGRYLRKKWSCTERD